MDCIIDMPQMSLRKVFGNIDIISNYIFFFQCHIYYSTLVSACSDWKPMVRHLINHHYYEAIRKVSELKIQHFHWPIFDNSRAFPLTLGFSIYLWSMKRIGFGPRQMWVQIVNIWPWMSYVISILRIHVPFISWVIMKMK